MNVVWDAGHIILIKNPNTSKCGLIIVVEGGGEGRGEREKEKNTVYELAGKKEKWTCWKRRVMFLKSIEYIFGNFYTSQIKSTNKNYK